MATKDARNNIAIVVAVKSKNSDTVANTDCIDKASLKLQSQAI